MYEKENVSLYCKLIYSCNSKCLFCIAHKYIQEQVPALTLKDLTANIDFFIRKYFVKEIVLSGGEPTLHSDFFEIVNMLNRNNLDIKLLSNCIKFSETKFMDQTKESLYRAGGDNRIMFSMHRSPEEIAKKKLEGILNLAHSKLATTAIITITKQNQNRLLDMLLFVAKLKEKFHCNLISVEIRMIYLGTDTMPEEGRKAIPDNFKEIKNYLEPGLIFLKRKHIACELWNIPLCYLEDPMVYLEDPMFNFNKYLYKRISTPTYIIDSLAQQDQACIYDWQKELHSDDNCKWCRIRNYCGGINQQYICKLNYPFLRTIR